MTQETPPPIKSISPEEKQARDLHYKIASDALLESMKLAGIETVLAQDRVITLLLSASHMVCDGLCDLSSQFLRLIMKDYSNEDTNKATALIAFKLDKTILQLALWSVEWAEKTVREEEWTPTNSGRTDNSTPMN